MPISNGVALPPYFFTNGGGRHAFDGKAKRWRAIRRVSEPIGAYRGELLQPRKHAIGQRHLVIAYGLHGVTDSPTPISTGAAPPSDILEISNGGEKARDVFINACSDLKLVRRGIRDEVFAKCREIIERLLSSPAKAHVGRKRLVSRTRHVIDAGALHIDRTRGKIVNRIDKNFSAGGVRGFSAGGDIDQGSRRVGGPGDSDKPRFG